MSTRNFLAVINHQVADNHHDFISIRELNADDMAKYNLAAQMLREWTGSDQFILLEYAYNQYLATADSLRKEYQTQNIPEGDSVMLTLNFALLGFLSMMRLYLDHSEFQLKHLPESDEFNTYKEAAAQEYDNVFAYRFCVALRNYAQHCGFPIGGMKASNELTVDDAMIKHSFEVYFDRNKLLSSYDRWKNKVKDDLQAQPQHFSVEDIVKDLMESLRRIQDKIAINAKPRLLEYVNIIQGLVEEAKHERGTPVIMHIKMRGKSSTPLLSLTKLPLRQVKLVLEQEENARV